MGLCSSASADEGVAAPLDPASSGAEVEASAATTATEAASASSATLKDLGLEGAVHDTLNQADRKRLRAVLAPVYERSKSEGAGISPLELGHVLVLDGDATPEDSSYRKNSTPLFLERLHAALVSRASADSSSSKTLPITALVRGLKDISNTHSTTEQQAAWMYKSMYVNTAKAGDENSSPTPTDSGAEGMTVKDLVPFAASLLNTTASATLAGTRGLKHFEERVKRLGLSGNSADAGVDPIVAEAVLEWCCESMGQGGSVPMDENSPVSEEMFRLWVEDMKAT